MSHMNSYIKKEGVLKRSTVNDFVPKGLLLRSINAEELQTIFKRAVMEDIIEPYDMGLFYIDVDKKAIVSAQSEVKLEELEKAVGKKLTRGWKYAELEPKAVTADSISANLQ